MQEALDGYRRAVVEEGNNPEAVRKRAMADPEVQAILADPAMQMILDQMSKDPKAVREWVVVLCCRWCLYSVLWVTRKGKLFQLIRLCGRLVTKWAETPWLCESKFLLSFVFVQLALDGSEVQAVLAGLVMWKIS